MVNQQDNQSAFSKRADQAALALKGDLSRKLGVELPSSQVEVGPDGKPPAPPPPEGSYARMAYDQARSAADAEQGQRAEDHQPEQGEVTEPQPQPQPEPQQPRQQEDTTSNAQARIRELVAALRDKDLQLDALRQNHEQSQQTLAELQAAQQAMEKQYRQVVDQSLESLDPETRAMVMADARIQEAVQRSQQQILNTLAPQLQEFRSFARSQEMQRLQGTYPGFDPEVHPPLIEAFQERNPHCSVEQAFRAVARPEELTAGATPASPVPPTIKPGAGPATPRYVPQEEQQADPETEIREELAQAAQLRASSDPAQRKLGLQAIEHNLRKRLFGAR